MSKLNSLNLIVIFICGLLVASCASRPPVKTNFPVSKYERSAWTHWIDQDKNCFDTRQEILKARSEIPPEIKKTRSKCSVVSGLWSDYYFDEKLRRASEIDIDHIVPLKHAHDSGASGWSSEQKAEFANDPENLVITNKSYNRKKGSKSLDRWLPVDIAYACKYYDDWMKIKKKYNLEVSQEELKSVDLRKCP